MSCVISEKEHNKSFNMLTRLILMVLSMTSIDIVLGNLNYDNRQKINVNKCCETNELYLDNKCRHFNQVNETLWVPTFTTEDGKINSNVLYRY